MLVGSYWLTVDLHNFHDTKSISATKAGSRIKQVLDSIVPVITSAAPASAPWVAPAAPANSYCTKKNNVADARAAFASPGLGYDSDPEGPAGDVSTIVLYGPTYASCQWYQLNSHAKGQTSFADVDILRGGSWLLPQLVADPPSDSYDGPYKVITVPGTSGAVLACNSANCVAIAGIGADAVAISFSDLGATRNLAGVIAMAKAVAAS